MHILLIEGVLGVRERALWFWMIAYRTQLATKTIVLLWAWAFEKGLLVGCHMATNLISHLLFFSK